MEQAAVTAANSQTVIPDALKLVKTITDGRQKLPNRWRLNFRT
ncbi:hypothetical protein O9992_18190 [Vibrio lentus]|nr:hypothetical protein [Vibrio lentus]